MAAARSALWVATRGRAVDGGDACRSRTERSGGFIWFERCHNRADGRAHARSARSGQWRRQAGHYGWPRRFELSMSATHAALERRGRAVSSGSSDVTIGQEVALMQGRPGLSALVLPGVTTPPFLSFVAPIEGEH